MKVRNRDKSDSFEHQSSKGQSNFPRVYFFFFFVFSTVL